jgi:chromate reductase
VISVSTGAIGGFGANMHLRQSLVFINVLCMQQPEAYVGGAAKLFNEQGELVVDTTKEFVKKFIDAFSAWVPRFVATT